jgi:hypothetical protein
MSKRLKVGSATIPSTKLCDEIVIEQRMWGIRVKTSGGFVDFSPVQWVEAVAAVEVVDVPTPGERLHREVHALRGGMPWPELTDATRNGYEAAAASLGITEGE